MDDWFGFQKGLVAVGLLAAVPGCPADDKDTATEGMTTNPGTTGDTGTGSTTGGTTGDTPTGSGTESATGTTGEGTTGEGTTDEPTTGEGTTDEGTTGEEPPALPPACKSYGAKIAECYMDPAEGMTEANYCGESHAYYEMAYGAECALAYEGFMACLSALPCEELMGEEPLCEPEETALDMACFKP